MAKIFIDVGGYEGESSLAALDPLFGFDRVYCFEPVKECFDNIQKQISNPRFTPICAGLLNRSATLPIFQAGTLGASVFSDSPDMADSKGTVHARFIAASEFFRENIAAIDKVWIKLNCEGAEVDILEDLLTSGEASKAAAALIDFDAQKIPSQRHRVQALVHKLKTAPFSYHFPEEVMFGMVTNYGAIRNWLQVSGAGESSLAARLRSLVYQAPFAFNRRYNGTYKIRLLRALKLRPPADQFLSPLRSL